MIDQPNAPYLLVIDTADYAGNFERDLCAYCTGRVGECNVGADMAERFYAETGLEPFDNVMDEADDHGCHRPVTMYPSGPKGGRPYNSVAISFDSRPTHKQIALIKERAAAFAALPERRYGNEPPAPRISRILGFRLIRQIITRQTCVEIL